MSANVLPPREGEVASPALPSLGRRASRGGVLTITAQALGFTLKLASTALLARALTPDDYGVFGISWSIVAVGSSFCDGGLQAAVIQRRAISEAQLSLVFWLGLTVSASLSLTLVAAGPLMASLFHDPRVGLATAVASLTFLFSALSTQHVGQLRKDLRFGVVAANDIVSLAAGLLVALWLAQRGAGYWALVAQQLVQGAACAVGGWTACRWRPSLPRRGEDIGAIVRYGVHLTSVNLVDNLARNADNCLIGRYCGVIQLGLYSRAYQFFILPVTQVTGPLGNVALATLSRLTEQPEAYRRSYLRAVEKIAIVTVPGAAILLVCADWVVAIMLGPHWGAVSAILRILGVAALTQPMTTTVWWLFTSQGRTREMTRWGGILSALAVAAFVIGLPWGARGVAGAYVVVDLVFRLPISFALVGRTGPVGARDLWRLVTPFMTIGGATVAALAAFRTCTAWSSPVTGIAVSAALAAVVTAAGLASYEGGRAAAFDLLRVVRGLATSLVARVARRAPT